MSGVRSGVAKDGADEDGQGGGQGKTGQNRGDD